MPFVNCIPYLGSKRKLAKEIVEVIYSRHPEVTKFYDVFGGGAAISIAATEKFPEVFYNEIDKGMGDLLKICLNEIPKSFYDWVDREHYHKHKTDNNYYGAYLRSIWSFGNNGKDYLYGIKIESLKKLAHLLVVDKSISALEELGYSEEILMIDKMHERRKFLQRNARVLELQNLQNLQRLERIENFTKANLSILNFDYADLEIDPSAVVYCDPPYKDTTGYVSGKFEYEQFYKWFKNLPNPAYLSSYSAPFLSIWEKQHLSTLSTNKTRTVEKLFWNGKWHK
jgi:site-specific DNA-adenine methylase